MSLTFVIDASVAIKWLIEEEHTADALAVLDNANLYAPDILVAECANVLYKKQQQKLISKKSALLAADALRLAKIELFPTMHLIRFATDLAIEINHPAYDCIYLALAVWKKVRFITADERFQRKVGTRYPQMQRDNILSLKQAGILFS